jgi:hypothetical protein
MHDDGSVDEQSLRRLVAFERAAGADGLLILGLSGEGVTLTIEERERVTEIVVEVAGGICWWDAAPIQPRRLHISSAELSLGARTRSWSRRQGGRDRRPTTLAPITALSRLPPVPAR